MYVLAQEFNFLANHKLSSPASNGICQPEQHIHTFSGTLIFHGEVLNNFGTLHTENNLQIFADVLSSVVYLPEYWSLELIAKELFDKGKMLFEDLYSLTLKDLSRPARIVKYVEESKKETPLLSSFNEDFIN